MRICMPIYLHQATIDELAMFDDDNVRCKAFQFSRGGTQYLTQYTPDAYAVLAALLRFKGAGGYVMLTLGSLYELMHGKPLSNNAGARLARLRSAVAELVADSSTDGDGIAVEVVCGDIANCGASRLIELRVSTFARQDSGAQYVLMDVSNIDFDFGLAKTPWDVGLAAKMYAYFVKMEYIMAKNGRGQLRTTKSIAAMHTGLGARTAGNVFDLLAKCGYINQTVYKGVDGKPMTAVEVNKTNENCGH